MLTFDEIKNALIASSSGKTIISDGNNDIQINSVAEYHSTTPSTVWVSGNNISAFKITESHTLKILS